MPRVVPRQIVAFIDQAFSWAQAQAEGVGSNLVRQHSGLLDLLEKLQSKTGPRFGNLKPNRPRWNWFFISGIALFSPVRLIRDAMSALPRPKSGAG